MIFPGLGENVPDYFQLLDSSPSGLPADLNHGSFRAPEVFLCYRRGRDRPPLTELGIISPGADPKERIRWLVNMLILSEQDNTSNVSARGLSWWSSRRTVTWPM